MMTIKLQNFTPQGPMNIVFTVRGRNNNFSCTSEFNTFQNQFTFHIPPSLHLVKKNMYLVMCVENTEKKRPWKRHSNSRSAKISGIGANRGNSLFLLIMGIAWNINVGK
ncbi:hypothetical protein FKM82_014503 [Ascaphus truei]